VCWGHQTKLLACWLVGGGPGRRRKDLGQAAKRAKVLGRSVGASGERQAMSVSMECTGNSREALTETRVWGKKALGMRGILLKRLWGLK